MRPKMSRKTQVSRRDVKEASYKLYAKGIVEDNPDNDTKGEMEKWWPGRWKEILSFQWRCPPFEREQVPGTDNEDALGNRLEEKR